MAMAMARHSRPPASSRQRSHTSGRRKRTFVDSALDAYDSDARRRARGDGRRVRRTPSRSVGSRSEAHRPTSPCLPTCSFEWTSWWSCLRGAGRLTPLVPVEGVVVDVDEKCLAVALSGAAQFALCDETKHSQRSVVRLGKSRPTSGVSEAPPACRRPVAAQRPRRLPVKWRQSGDRSRHTSAPRP